MTRKHTITYLSTATDHTAYSTSYVKGVVLSVQYVKGATPISATADLDITTKDSSRTILGSLVIGGNSFEKAPRFAIVNSTNGSIANEAGYIPIADERIAVTVTNSSKVGQTGTFYLYEQL